MVTMETDRAEVKLEGLSTEQRAGTEWHTAMLLPWRRAGPRRPPRVRVTRVSVASELRKWEQVISGQGPWFRLLLLVWSTLVWFTPPAMLCLGVRTATARDLPDMLKCVCGMCAMYSAATPAFFFGFRRHGLLGVLGTARRLAELAEKEYGHFEEETAHIAHWMNVVRRNGTIYINVGCAMATVEQFSGAPTIPPCIQIDNLPGRLLIALLESIKWSYLATCFFSMMMLVACLLLSVKAQYHSLCLRLQRRGSAVTLISCARQLHDILLLEADLRRLLYQALFHILSGAFVVPLINTYQLLFEERSMFTALTLSTLPLVYGSLSILGDLLALGAEEVALSAYRGPAWTEGGEDVAAMRLRLLLIQSSGRNAPFAMSVVGSFTRHSAYQVLKSWYQYLQLLINSVRSE